MTMGNSHVRPPVTIGPSIPIRTSPFVDWLVSQYGESGADRILARYNPRDPFNRANPNNLLDSPYYRHWITNVASLPTSHAQSQEDYVNQQGSQYGAELGMAKGPNAGQPKGERDWFSELLAQAGIAGGINVPEAQRSDFLLQNFGAIMSGINNRAKLEAEKELSGSQLNTQLATQQSKETEARLNKQWYQDVQSTQSRIDAQNRGMALQQAQAQGSYDEFLKANDTLNKLVTGFEKARQEILSTTAPRDWLIREKYRLAINPYAGKSIQGIPNVVNPGTYISQIPQKPTIKYEGAPELPAEVKKFTGGRDFGAPIETPSGQQWAASPKTAQEMMFGYAEGLGQQPADILFNMQQMLPNNPSSGVRWAPPRQR